jgi:hypothetical protein
MKYEQNPLTNDWLCWIPNTSQAYYCKSKKEAAKFCEDVNKAIENKVYAIINGKLVKCN